MPKPVAMCTPCHSERRKRQAGGCVLQETPLCGVATRSSLGQMKNPTAWGSRPGVHCRQIGRGGTATAGGGGGRLNVEKGQAGATARGVRSEDEVVTPHASAAGRHHLLSPHPMSRLATKTTPPPPRIGANRTITEKRARVVEKEAGERGPKATAVFCVYVATGIAGALRMASSQ